jgi:electron transport complex protein RnfG
MRDMLKLGIRLLLICAISAGLLGATYSVTKEPIAKYAELASLEANKAVSPSAESFKEMNLSDFQSKPGWDESFADVTMALEAQKGGKTVGYVVKVNGSGYAGKIAMTVGLDLNGKYTVVNIDSLNETPGLGMNATKDEFKGQYTGKSTGQELTVTKVDPTNDNEIKAISGATITSKAVTSATNVVGRFAQAFLVGK